MPDEAYGVGDRVQVYLDSQFWKCDGWFDGTVVRVDPYSAHRSFFWVELDTAVSDTQGGMVTVLSVLNPKKIRKIDE